MSAAKTRAHRTWRPGADPGDHRAPDQGAGQGGCWIGRLRARRRQGANGGAKFAFGQRKRIRGPSNCITSSMNGPKPQMPRKIIPTSSRARPSSCSTGRPRCRQSRIPNASAKRRPLLREVGNHAQGTDRFGYANPSSRACSCWTTRSFPFILCAAA